MSWEETDPIPMERVAQFVRQVAHDVRNGLNAIDLQSAYLAEIAEGAEVKEEAQRLRGMVRETTKLLQVLSRKFQHSSVEPIDCPADILIESLQSRMEQNFPQTAESVVWASEAGGESVAVDVESFTEVVAEILRNAFHFAESGSGIRIRAFLERPRFIMDVTESNADVPAADPETWGVQPLITARRGGYGLGLFKARASLAAQGGTLSHRYDPAKREVISRLSLPLAGA